MLMTDEQLFTVDEIAALHRVSTDTILRLIKSGELEADKIGKQYRIRKSDWEAYLRKNRQSK